MTELKELMLRTPRFTLGIAESLTCGRVQARVGSISGASDFFLGGMTAYSLEQKVRHLGVDGPAAAAVNSVSANVAGQMARGACALFRSDLAISTTGYAEPSSDWNVVHPFAWWALAHRKKEGWELRGDRVEFPGASRSAVQELVAESALGALIAYLREIRA